MSLYLRVSGPNKESLIGVTYHDEGNSTIRVGREDLLTHRHPGRTILRLEGATPAGHNHVVVPKNGDEIYLSNHDGAVLLTAPPGQRVYTCPESDCSLNFQIIGS